MAVRILGVNVTDVSMREAIALLTDLIHDPDPRTRTVFFVNAHTLNCAADDPTYLDVLNRADVVFGDGTGVRWAARAQGVTLRDNVNGTDLVPQLFAETARRGLRYYLLGATAQAIERAAERARVMFPGWEQAGYHHGYVRGDLSIDVVNKINKAKPHLLLVGMGNPIQERWIDTYRDMLQVPLVMGTGGLFDYWAGNLDRAPSWMRKAGVEWLHLLRRQPKKAERYILGNPKFLLRVGLDTLKGRK
ncbi:MAG: WecB/TagA/CpsF family glycosyltransferase [Sandaracinaceae bacterium]|nr:WecB/TagA/CpsF family glycosyltransferase [Sandaracinaceae bacterium]